MSSEVELRCPTKYRRMFGKLVRKDEEVVVSDNLLEFSCRPCTKTLQTRDSGVERVVHRYNIGGELVQTAAYRYSK